MAVRHLRIRGERVTFGDTTFLTDSRGFLIPQPSREGDATLYARIVAHPNYIDDASGQAPDAATLLALAERDLAEAASALFAAEAEVAEATNRARACRAKRDKLRTDVARLTEEASAEAPAPEPKAEPAKADETGGAEDGAEGPGGPGGEGADGSAPAAREALDAMTWHELRAEAKAHGINTTGRNRDEITTAIMAAAAA